LTAALSAVLPLLQRAANVGSGSTVDLDMRYLNEDSIQLLELALVLGFSRYCHIKSV
jgi:hypothetical protein